MINIPKGTKDVLPSQSHKWQQIEIHDKDINADGEKKKEHFHVLLMFGGVKSYEQVLEFVKFLNCPIPIKCHNAKALVRYMAHLDNPEKFQYSISDIKGHGGVDVAELLRPSSSERYCLIKEMLEFVKNNHIIEFQDLIDYSYSNHFDDWFPLLCDNSAFVIVNYIKSCRHRGSQNINYSTGEIL